mgnify:CR=1 FL=1
MPARLEIDLGAQRPPPRRRAGEPMRILLVGDFGGASLAERVPLADRPTHRVDLERLVARGRMYGQWAAQAEIAAALVPLVRRPPRGESVSG